MKPGVLFAIAAGLWLAGCLEQALPHRLAIFGAEPDFLLVYLAGICPYLSRTGATWTGFAAGAMHGALAGANMTHYVVSRTITSALLSWQKEMRLSASIWIAALTGFCATLAAQVLLMFLAAPHGILSFLGATIGSALYNGVLAIPLYLASERILGPARR